MKQLLDFFFNFKLQFWKEYHVSVHGFEITNDILISFGFLCFSLVGIFGLFILISWLHILYPEALSKPYKHIILIYILYSFMQNP